MKRIVFIVLLALIVVSCDDMQVVDIMSDLSGAPHGMVLIPGGEAMIGAPASDNIDEVFFEKGIVSQEHTVFVDAFYIDIHEVTWDTFYDFLIDTGHDVEQYRHTVDPKLPAHANYFYALAYAEWVGKRLPTDTEWEYAARGGLVGMMYPWGNEPPNDDLARHQGEQYRQHEVNDPVTVGSYPPNDYGLYDMGGNLAEWVYTPNVDFDDRRSIAVHRGGSWFSGNHWFCRVYVRAFKPQSITGGFVGFRCVIDATTVHE